jgi:hypothetical protein
VSLYGPPRVWVVLGSLASPLAPSPKASLSFQLIVGFTFTLSFSFIFNLCFGHTSLPIFLSLVLCKQRFSGLDRHFFGIILAFPFLKRTAQHSNEVQGVTQRIGSWWVLTQQLVYCERITTAGDTAGYRRTLLPTAMVAPTGPKIFATHYDNCGFLDCERIPGINSRTTTGLILSEAVL